MKEARQYILRMACSGFDSEIKWKPNLNKGIRYVKVHGRHIGTGEAGVLPYPRQQFT